MNPVVVVPPMSNREFIETHAMAGRIGLAGGPSLSSKMIQLAERRVDASDAEPSLWSHAFLFQGKRVDGHHWVIESDMEIHRRHIRLGVQENRIDKLCDPQVYSSLAILDFGLTPEQTNALLAEGLEMVAGRIRYSIRELIGTLVALRHPQFRTQDNILARERSCYCSAFVHHVFNRIGIDLAPGLGGKNSTPEDISRTPVPHTTYLMRAERTPDYPITNLKRRVKTAVRKVAGKRPSGPPRAGSDPTGG